MSSALLAYNDSYPPGPSPRGFEVGVRAGQNLADGFPEIDHFEGGVAIQIKSTEQVDDAKKFLDLIKRDAERLRAADGILEGRNRAGQIVRVDMNQAKGRGLLYVVPLEPIRWNPTTIANQLAAISNRTKVLIRIIAVRGLRGR